MEYEEIVDYVKEGINQDEDDSQVQDKKDEKPSEPVRPKPAQYALGQRSALEPVTVIARQIMNGDWGHGSVRDKKLIQAGYDPTEVYAKFNELFGTNSGPFEPYDVILTSNTLNVRKGPGFDHYIVTTLIDDQNVYTIVEEDADHQGNRWGYLRSGLGWIMLQYTKKVGG